MKIAVLSDIHGNSWALKAVLRDIELKVPDLIVNLGDSLYGPLNPKDTYKLLRMYSVISICGNQDRLIIENVEKETNNATLQFVIKELNNDALTWLKALPGAQAISTDVFACHGTPQSDSVYLLEKLIDSYVTVNDITQIEASLKSVKQKVVLCGHSHTARFMQIQGRFIINPGSVGLPAYDDDLPVFHKMKSYQNNAQYCIADVQGNSIKVEQISLPYDYEKAVACALGNGRNDWAKWLKTGMA
jgi:putative phosphoesterase